MRLVVYGEEYFEPHPVNGNECFYVDDYENRFYIKRVGADWIEFYFHLSMNDGRIGTRSSTYRADPFGNIWYVDENFGSSQPLFDKETYEAITRTARSRL